VTSATGKWAEQKSFSPKEGDIFAWLDAKGPHKVWRKDGIWYGEWAVVVKFESFCIAAPTQNDIRDVNLEMRLGDVAQQDEAQRSCGS
jgi:hypothetical protein